MSDFLLDLARRSLGLAPVVQPILPSLFEPIGAAATGAGWAGEITREVEGDRAPIPTRTDSMPPAVAEPGAIESTRIEHVVERPPAILQPAATPAPTRPLPPATPLTSARPTESQEDPWLELHRSEPSAPATEILRERTERIREERTSEHHVVDVRAERTIVRDVPAPTRTPAPAPHEPGEAPLERPIAHGVPRRTDPAIVTLPAAIPRAIPAPAPERLQTGTPEPSIRVHIGRVEVRAVFPSTTAPLDKPRPAAPPVMPLEEYLKQRGGRG